MNRCNNALRLIRAAMLVMVMASCSKAGSEPSGEVLIGNEGMPADTLVKLGKTIDFAPIVNGNPRFFSWSVDDREVAATRSFSFAPSEAGVYRIVFAAGDSRDGQLAYKMVSVTVRRYYGGFYVVNEGSGDGSIGYYDAETGTVHDQIFRANNPGQELTGTTQFGTICGERFYVVSKGPWSGSGGSITVIDLNTFRLIGRIGLPGLQGMALQVIDERTGVVSTDRGAYRVNLVDLTLGERLERSEGLVCGDLCLAGNYLFVASREAGVSIYSLSGGYTLLDKTIPGVSTGFARTVDGGIWAGIETADPEVAGGYRYGLVRIDPATLATETVSLPAGLQTFGLWDAWKPGYLQASITDRALYIPQLANPWMGGTKVYRYTIGNTASLDTPFAAVPDPQYGFYGTTAVHPVTGDLYVITNREYSKDNRIVIFDGRTGNLKQEIVYDHLYQGSALFPSMIVFDTAVNQ